MTILCRSCGQSGLMPVLSLGCTPLANRLLTATSLNEPEPTYPLELIYCPHCTLVQITETVPPEELFNHYLYFSSFSDTMLKSVQSIVDRLIHEQHLSSDSMVVEIASNDGYLLQYYVAAGVPVVGIEPACRNFSISRLPNV
jgi:Putative zinc binding domain